MSNVSEVHENQHKGTASDDREKRLDRVDELEYEGHSTHTIARIVADECKVVIRTAYQDIADARARRAPDVEAERESSKQRAAAHWKLREWKADRAGNTQAANYAYDKRCKVLGDYAPKKIEISGSVSVGIEIDAVIGVLDASGMAALEVVLSQVEAAKKAGKLTTAPQPLLEAPSSPAPATTKKPTRKK